MISSLSESPITAKKIFDWEEKLINNEMLVRDIIDLDTNFIDDEKLAKSIKERVKKKLKKNPNIDTESEDSNDDDEFNISLASLEIELKPKILEAFSRITKNYKKLISYQRDKLECVLKNKHLVT